jgi:hypothetical protein
MRQNKRSIQVHSLLKEKKVESKQPKAKTKIVCIPGDHHHTCFEVALNKDEKEIIEKYNKRYK